MSNKVFDDVPRVASYLGLISLGMLVAGDFLDNDLIITWARRLFAGVAVFVFLHTVIRRRPEV